MRTCECGELFATAHGAWLCRVGGHRGWSEYVAPMTMEEAEQWAGEPVALDEPPRWWQQSFEAEDDLERLDRADDAPE